MSGFCRPYSKDMGYEDVDVSAVLVVRYVIQWLLQLFFFFFYNCCCWYGISVATKPITVCPSFSLGACLGIPSSAPSCRLLLRRVYQKLMLINFCLSSMIRCLYLPFGNNIFCSVVNCWLLFVWERLPAYSLVTVRALMLLVP